MVKQTCKCSNTGILKTFKFCPYCGGEFKTPPKRYKYEGQGLANNGRYAILTGEQRPPKKGEYYLSGCKGYEIAYKAPNDLSRAYLICKVVD